MADNSQKIPFVASLNRFAERKVAAAIQLTGKSLPCSVTAVTGSIVKVKFELTNIPFTLPNVVVPIFGPEYIRYPTQVGDKGVVIACDARLGGISGLGSGTADLSQPANLSALFFMPLGNANWTPTDNPGAVVIYGPQGAVIRDTAHSSVVTVTEGMISATAATIGMTGEVIINGSPFAFPGLLGLVQPDGLSILSAAGVLSVNWSGHGGGGGGGNPWAPGFGFFVGGLMYDNELLGAGVWSINVKYTNGDARCVIKSEFAPTSDATINLETFVSGTRSIIGKIFMGAGQFTGVVDWIPSPYTHPAQVIMEVRAPSPPDPSWANVTAAIHGSPA